MFILHMLGIKHDFNNYNKNINYVRNTSIMKPKSNSKHTIRILICILIDTIKYIGNVYMSKYDNN
jgi:hypothetical protein